MSATLIRLPHSAQPALTALVVEPHLPHLLFVLSTLSSLKFDVTVASSFKEAKTSLVTARPMVLIADVRLGEFNGLHLVLRGQSIYPRMPAIVTSEVEDPVLQSEAERLGATYVTLPTTSEELVAALYRTLLQKPGAGQARIRPPFERRHGERRAVRPAEYQEERRRAERRRDPAAILHALAAPH